MNKLKLKLDYTKISDVEVDGINMNDYPDFCDSFISSATYNGRAMSNEELDILNEDRDFVYEEVLNWIY